MRRAFTLVELLMVVAILSLLTSAALPNFLESQVRAKLARARSDLRTIAGALETYRLDMNAYPPVNDNGTTKYLWHLSTPVAYLTCAKFKDPFTPNKYVSITQQPTYLYHGFNERGVLNADANTGELMGVYTTPFLGYRAPGDLQIKWYALVCHGPFADISMPNATDKTFRQQNNLGSAALFCNFLYDATNGTRSFGQVFRPGGMPLGVGENAARLMMGQQ
jgi:prepilin-type N-terminal cleavage/methylation domain-containing protein